MIEDFMLDALHCHAKQEEAALIKIALGYHCQRWDMRSTTRLHCL